MIKRIALALLLCVASYAAFAALPLRGGMGVVVSCIYNGNNIGSCILGSDTTHTLTATEPVFTGPVSIGFTASPADGITSNGALLYYGLCPSREGTTAGANANLCFQAPQITACYTGGVPPNPPYYDQGFVSWQPPGGIVYNAENDTTTWVTSVPAYSPIFTFNDTTGSIARGYTARPSLMTSICGSGTTSDFVNSAVGNMPDLGSALASMQTGESVEVKPAPSPIPFWPSGDNNIGSGSVNSPPHDITVNFDAGVKIGYPNTSKGVLDVGNNGTTINGNGVSIYWLQPGNNQACVAWEAGLDLTVNDLNCNMAGMGLFRSTVRTGISTVNNVKLENIGCQDGACSYGHNHNMYLGTVDVAGMDIFNATNLFNPDVQARGWNSKIRIPNTNITQSAFIARVNDGASSPHGAMDFPCGGTHSLTFSAIGENVWAHTNGEGNYSNFLIQADEERGTNATTHAPGLGVGASNLCPTKMWLPSANPITVTVTSPSTFTTTTDPATLFPNLVFGAGYGTVWDLGVSGLMVNGPASISSWSGPVGGVYTVTLGQDPGACYNGEGTLPLNQGVGIYSCFAGSSGTVTLYSQAAVTVVTNTPTTASISTPVNPALMGFAVGDTLFDNIGTCCGPGVTSITSITGTGPYTVNMSCAAASGSGNCLNPGLWQQINTGTPLPSSVDFLMKGGPIQVTASTTGTGCTTNVICGITVNPLGWLISPGMGVYGTDIASGCVVAGQIGFAAPVTGSGTGYIVGDHITLAGGTFTTPAVVAVASVSSGAPTAYTIVSGGVYTALPKTFSQASTTGSGTGAQLHYPYPQPVFGGSAGNYTITVGQTSGANCITGSTTNAVYQVTTITNIIHDHDLVIWDGSSPFSGQSAVVEFNGAAGTSNAFQGGTATNGIYIADSGNGITWGTGANKLTLGITDGGGNIFCNARTDLVTSPRCAIPAFTTASFTGAISGGVLTAASGASACKPGMFVWDDEGEFHSGYPGFTVPGTRIISGGPTSFVLSFPPGGANSTDVPSTSMNCGWGTPSSAENATIASDGIMTINSGLVGSIHVNDYLADISGTLPSNVQVTAAIDSTHWQTNYSGAGVAAEYMVSVR